MAHLLGGRACTWPIRQVVFEAVTLGVNDGARIIVGETATAIQSAGPAHRSTAAGLRSGHPAVAGERAQQTDTLDPNHRRLDAHR